MRNLLIFSAWALTVITVFSCTPADNTQYAPPTVVSASALVEGNEAVLLHCELSDARVESCGFIYGEGNDDRRVECTLKDKSFEVRLTDLVQGVVYSWCAYYAAGGSELRSETGTFRLTSDADPAPIPDPGFKKYLLTEWDKDGNGEISYREASRISRIDVYSEDWGIHSLEGIEYMANLEYLTCNGREINGLSGGTLQFVDVSSNPELRHLCVSNCPQLGYGIKGLDLSRNLKLESVWCNSCELESLNVSECGRLKSLAFDSNYISGSLDFSPNPLLEELHCRSNLIASVDVSGCPGLKILDVSDNKLTEIDVSACTKLVSLCCWGNWITSLDVSNNPLLGTDTAVPYPGLWCFQKQDADGHNCLKTLYVAEGQSIPYVTEDRNIEHLPAETQIIVIVRYALGDIVDLDGIGIVAVESEDLTSFLLLSVKEIHDWTWEASDNWCKSYGKDWRMPTIDELDAIRVNFTYLNQKLNAVGYPPITSENKCYWSCTPYELEEGYYYRERLWDGSIWCYGFDEWHECHANYTRAVKTVNL